MRRFIRGSLAALLLLTGALAGTAGRAAAQPASAPVVAHHTAPGTTVTGKMPPLDAATRDLIARALSSSGRGFVCSPASATTNTSATQSCTIHAASGVCIERSTNPAVTQTCTFEQSETTKKNEAVAVQVIEQRDGGESGSKTQTGSQTISTTQSNLSGSNVNWSVQVVKQFLGAGANNPDSEVSRQQQQEAQQEAAGVPTDFTSLIQSLVPTEVAQEDSDPATLPKGSRSPVTQQQQSQQTIQVCQGAAPDPCTTTSGMTGDNVNGDYQSLRQWEWANNAPSIDQEQNSQPGTCVDSSSSTLNMCSIVHQNTSGGQNLSGLFEYYRQFQRALHTLSGQELQDTDGLGEDVGGLGHDIFQTSLGDPSGPQREWILTGQRARQVQRANDTGTLFQSQDPHVDKGYLSRQTGSDNDTWDGWIGSDQTQLKNGAFASPSSQAQDLSYSGTSTGDIVATVRGTQNGNTQTQQCPPGQPEPGFDSCDAVVIQGAVGPQ